MTSAERTFSHRRLRLTHRLRATVCAILLLTAALGLALLTGCAQASGAADKHETRGEQEAQDADATSQAHDQDKEDQEEVVSTQDALTKTDDAVVWDAYDDARDSAVSALLARMDEEREALYVYKDYGLTQNHFSQKAKMAGNDSNLVKDMDENWQENPYAGKSCIRCEQITRSGDWGGWLFLNGYLPKGESVPKLNDGTMDGQGLDLTGAKELRFWARGEHGGEKVEFFTAGFGYDGETGERTAPHPDSTRKRSLGVVSLTDDWREYTIRLNGANLNYIVCGFGYVLSGDASGSTDNVFFLDEIRFEGDIECLADAPVMLRSYDTDNIYIQNAAFSYDNALVAMALISENRQEEAAQLLDAFVYAIDNDRSDLDSGKAKDTSSPTIRTQRVRNAYASGDISAYPGWESGARLPGWYDATAGKWLEDRYQVGSNVGNTSYVALALLQYHDRYGNPEYLRCAQSLMNWVIDTCSDSGDGFTGGFDGWAEADPPVVYPFTYKSIEHNIDAYAAFSQLHAVTSDERYADAAQSALRFIKSMYDDKQGLFMTGTTDDGKTPNTDVVVLDAQVWSAMALQDEFKPFEDALDVVTSMQTDEGGYPFCQENKNGGWWAEGTAYTALMWRGRGKASDYAHAMDTLAKAQQEDGLFSAASVDNLSTGMGLFDGSPWEYSRDAHIAPTAWFVMAANGFNPYVFPATDTSTHS